MRQLNKAVQNVVFAMLKDDSEIAAKKSLDIMVELYRKKVWVVSFIPSISIVIFPGLAQTNVSHVLRQFLSVEERSDGSRPERFNFGDSPPGLDMMPKAVGHTSRLSLKSWLRYPNES